MDFDVEYVFESNTDCWQNDNPTVTWVQCETFRRQQHSVYVEKLKKFNVFLSVLKLK